MVFYIVTRLNFKDPAFFCLFVFVFLLFFFVFFLIPSGIAAR